MASEAPITGGANSDPGNSGPSELELFEQEEEVRLGTDAQTSAANAALRTLARASRSYLIYDPQNKAIKGFLEALNEAFTTYQERFGEMTLDVRPFELTMRGETIYVERDRERSLAFKLFRDGVRRLVIGRDADWDELTHLLEIISVRYVGIHQNPADDDMVTLLWKAGFKHIRFEAVEGFVPEDDEPEGGVQMGVEGIDLPSAGEAASARVPPDFDLPAPTLGEPSIPSFTALDPDKLARIRQEDSSATLPSATLSLIEELLIAAADPTDPLAFDEMSSLLKEIRDFLLAEDQLEKLLKLFELLQNYRNSQEQDREVADRVLGGFVDARALTRLIRSVPRDAHDPPIAFFQLLNHMSSDPVPLLLDILAEERGVHERRITRKLVEYFLPERQGEVLKRLETATGSVASDLLRMLARGAPETALQALNKIVKSGDSEVQLEFLKLAREVDLGGQIRSILVMLLRSPEEEVRIRTLEYMVETGDKSAFPVVRKEAEKRLARASEREVVVLGESLAKLDPGRALKLFAEWRTVRGFWQRLLYGNNLLSRVFPKLIQAIRSIVPSPWSLVHFKAMVNGLRCMEQKEARDTLQALSTHSDNKIARLARETIARSRRSDKKLMTAQERS